LGSNENSISSSSNVGLDGGVEQGVLKSIMNGSISSSCSILGRAAFIVLCDLLVE
jgi:hypothetical protein